MKVSELRKIIAELPDNAEVLLSVNGGSIDSFETIQKPYRSRGTICTALHYVWGDRYQTREVYNAYQANDDRYGGRVLCIEVGVLSD